LVAHGGKCDSVPGWQVSRIPKSDLPDPTINPMKKSNLLGAILTALAVWAPAIQAQVTIPESFALPSSSADKTKPGFKVRTVQASTANGTLPNTLARTEDQLAGLLLQPNGTPYANIADLTAFNADGTYDESNIISYTDGTMPGIPGTEGHTDNIAMEMVTYLDLPVGEFGMIVNSDDGFRVTTGDVRDRLNEIKLAEFDAGRGAGDTTFTFKTTKAGLYAFRLIYFEGGGGNSVDWFLSPPTDFAARTHVNAGDVKAYRALTTQPTLGPAIKATSPLQGSANQPPRAGMTALIEDGSAPLNQASLRITLAGVDITSKAVVTKTGTVTKVVYAPTDLAQPLSDQVYGISFDDPTATGGKRNATLTYKTGAYANLTLPSPIYFEGFDGVAEGSLPAGWTTTSPIAASGFEDLNDPSSDSYLVWVVISKIRVQELSARWDANRRLYTPEGYINGQRIESLIDKNFAYHESDIRSGSQYAELFSPTVNLTGKTDVYLVYHSVYEQNQDNIAGVEYSIDDGATWLPVVYMVDEADIAKKADGTTDAEATLTNPQTDTAVYNDPNTGEEIGRSYGAFVKSAQSTWKDLAAYISGRVNDNSQESKRVEKFRLEKADNQAKVKLRFFQAGTGSWYFGVDSVGFYSITTIDPPSLTAQPENASRFVGTSASFKVGATGQSLTYQWQKDGADITGATADTLVLNNLTKANAGKYRAIVKNPGGQVTSAEATLTVQDIPGDASSLKNGLAVYLPFDGNLTDVSGKNRNGTAVGTPELTTGLVGSGAVRVKSVRADSNYNFVTLGSNANLNFGESTAFTVAYWQKTERVAGDPSVVANKNWGSGNNRGWTIGTQTDGRLELNYRRTEADGLSRKDLDLAGQKLNENVWRHVVVVWDINNEAVSYVDGVKVANTPIAPGTGSLNDPALALNIGQDGTGAYTDGEWDGLIDDFAIWDRPLSATEVSTLYAFGVFGDSFLAPPVTTDLAVHLKFDGNLTDSSGKNRNGTAVGKPELTTGSIGSGAVRVKSVRADSNYNFVTLGSNGALNFGETKDFTVAYWQKTERVAGDPSVVANKNWGSGNNTGWSIGTQTDGRLEWNYRRTGVDGLTRKDLDLAGQKLNETAWHHVVVAFGINGTVDSYVDGIQVNSQSIAPGTGSLNDAALALNIGQDGTGAYTDGEWDGLIDDLGIWERKLSKREVATLYGQGLNGVSLDGSGGGGTRPTVTIARGASGVVITWSGSGRLQSAASVSGPWTDVPGATSPSTQATSSAAGYFRVAQ